MAILAENAACTGVAAAILACLLIVPPAALAQPVPPAERPMRPPPGRFRDLVVEKPEHVAGNVYRVVGGVIVNMPFAVGSVGIVMVDSNFPELTDRILAAVRQVSDKPIKVVINTHHHFDHSDGNGSLAVLGAVIVVHENALPRLALPADGEPAPERAESVITFKDRLDIHLDGEEIEVIHVTAGHTDNDVLVYFRSSDILAMGDLFVGQYPGVDLPGGGRYLGLIDNLNAAVSLAGPNTRIVRGHGAVATRDQLIEYRDALVGIYDRVKVLVDDGMTLEQVVQARPSADYDAAWAGPRGSRGIVAAAYAASARR